MKLGIFLVILLILGNGTIPYNNNPAYADEIILAEINSVSGSDAVSTDTLTKERCFVHVDIVIKSAHHGIYHRNNPDKTFYPGDAFVYNVNTWTDGCGHFQPCPIESTANLLRVPNGIPCVKHGHDGEGNPSGGTYGGASNSGTAIVSSAIGESDSISLSKKAIAEQWVCNKAGSKWFCGWRTVSASAGYTPPVILPKIEVTMEKDGFEFAEDDGYTSRNLDKSYYSWDAINVVHNPIYKWKNERVGTLFVDITKNYSPLTLEDEFQCELALCANTMTVSGFLPWTQLFDYGSGNTVYNATSLDFIGEHTISYNTKLFNIAPKIDENDNSTSSLVVEYEPIYDSYIYPVLSDDEKLAFHDRIGIALHYFGSESTNANPDDIIGIHEDRRSKINDYFYSTWGADPWEFDFIDGTVSIKTDYSDEIELIWDEAHDVGIIINEMPVKISKDIAEKLIGTEFAEIIPFEVEQHATANFLKSGYGKIFFEYPGIHGVVLDTVKKIPRFENATVYDTLQSRHFAGHDVSHLSFSEYMYPESFFHNIINVTAVDSAQNRDSSVEISLDVQPRFDIDGTQYIDQYMYDKIFFDSIDDGFSQIITGLDIDANPIVIPNNDDIYPIFENEISGFGSITLDKTRRTASSFTEYDIIDPQVFANDDVLDVSNKYLLDSKSARLSIPLTTGLDALSPFHVIITADNGIDDPVTNTFDNTWYDFSVDYTYQINMDSDNVLNMKRDMANPRVLLFEYDENFGEITSLQINDTTITKDNLPECFKVDSPSTCVIAVPQDHQLSELNITGTNIWNGISSVILPEIDKDMLNPPPKDLENLIFDVVLETWIVIILAFLLMILAISWIIKKYSEE